VTSLIKREILDIFDRNLNLDPIGMRSDPTAENIAVVSWNRLRPRMASPPGLSVTLYMRPAQFWPESSWMAMLRLHCGRCTATAVDA
jgi:6-pyruvoyltetrahydropterin/6-carboxytetrahydropterin synthase